MTRYASFPSSAGAFALALLASGCASIAVATAPAKQTTAPTPESEVAQADFWATFHGGRYDEIERLLESHARVALAAPAEPVTVSHLGWLHAWKFAERARVAPSANITAHATLARRYFEEAVTLRPEEPRFQGFLASFTMTEAILFANEKELRRGYFMMRDAVSAWPEFNLFTSGYTMSVRPAGDPRFDEALAQQWETLDRCFGESVGRDGPRFEKYLPLERREGRTRACWNSWIAPHNWEGFFLSFGDLLARARDTKNARAMYEATKLSKTYSAWPYREVLERRLARVETLAATLEPAGRTSAAEDITMVASSFSCMGCHQESGPPSVATLTAAR